MNIIERISAAMFIKVRFDKKIGLLRTLYHGNPIETSNSAQFNLFSILDIEMPEPEEQKKVIFSMRKTLELV